MVRRTILVLIIWLMYAVFPALGQGTMRFTVTITGREMRGNGRLIIGSGNLTLTGATLSYQLLVPVTRVLPVEAHFHGPSVAGEMPIFSLTPYEFFPGTGVFYQGERSFDSKWLPDIRAGNWYINLHNPEYDNALMTGFIVPVVPEPRPVFVLAGGLVVISFLRFRTSKLRVFTAV